MTEKKLTLAYGSLERILEKIDSLEFKTISINPYSRYKLENGEEIYMNEENKFSEEKTR